MVKAAVRGKLISFLFLLLLVFFLTISLYFYSFPVLDQFIRNHGYGPKRKP